jgi:hypothetical protein
MTETEMIATVMAVAVATLALLAARLMLVVIAPLLLPGRRHHSALHLRLATHIPTNGVLPPMAMEGLIPHPSLMQLGLTPRLTIVQKPTSSLRKTLPMY